MAVLTGSFYSAILGMDVDVDVILPQYSCGLSAKGIDHPLPVFSGRHPTLYFYHGHTGNHGATIRKSPIERYAQKYGLAVVFPSTHLSTFVDMKYGGQYYTYLTEELPRVMRRFFPLSTKREETFVAGISNGGVAAYRCGLSRPDLFSAIGCISGISISRLHECVGKNLYAPPVIPKEEDSFSKRQRQLSFGVEGIKDTIHDARYLAGEIIRKGLPPPRIFHSSGDDDLQNYAIAHADKAFFESFPGNPFDYTFVGGPGGHVMEYFDPQIERFIRWLHLPEVQSVL